MKKILSTLLCLILLISGLLSLAPASFGAFEGDDKIVIVIDPGHGGGNVGTAARNVGEKTMTLKLGFLLRDELEANGNFTVHMTRTGDYDLDLYERAEFANEKNADILISLHFDGNPVTYLNGVTTFTSVIDEFAVPELSASIAKGVSASIGLKNNGVVRREDTEGYYWSFDRQWDCKDPSLSTLSDYYTIPTWCSKFGIPSIIVEHGFFSNYGDVAKIFATGALEKMAKAEAQAIIDYYTNHTHIYSGRKTDFPSNCMYTGKSSEHCSVCGHRRNTVSLSPEPDNHYWQAVSSTKASCGVDGKVVYECRITRSMVEKGWNGSVHTKTDITPAPTQHNYVLTSERAVTHTTDGYKEYTCTYCSDSFRDIYKAEGHSYELTEETLPTCTKEGSRHYKCPNCRSEYTETLAALGHTIENEQKREPTCTEEGYIRGTCSVCGEETVTTLSATGHKMEHITKHHPTCTESGTEVLTCSVCGYEEITPLAPLGHTYECSETGPTCTEDGIRKFTCKTCFDEYEEKIEKLGHKKSENGTVVEKATLFKSGKTEYTCENACGSVITETIPSLFSQYKTKIIICSAIIAFLILFAVILIIIIVTKRKSQKLPSDPEDEPSIVSPDTEVAPKTEIEHSESAKE